MFIADGHQVFPIESLPTRASTGSAVRSELRALRLHLLRARVELHEVLGRLRAEVAAVLGHLLARMGDVALSVGGRDLSFGGGLGALALLLAPKLGLLLSFHETFTTG